MLISYDIHLLGPDVLPLGVVDVLRGPAGGLPAAGLRALEPDVLFLVGVFAPLGLRDRAPDGVVGPLFGFLLGVDVRIPRGLAAGAEPLRPVADLTLVGVPSVGDIREELVLELPLLGESRLFTEPEGELPSEPLPLDRPFCWGVEARLGDAANDILDCDAPSARMNVSLRSVVIFPLDLQGSFCSKKAASVTHPPPTRTITVLFRKRTRHIFCLSPILYFPSPTLVNLNCCRH